MEPLKEDALTRICNQAAYERRTISAYEVMNAHFDKLKKARTERQTTLVAEVFDSYE